MACRWGRCAWGSWSSTARTPSTRRPPAGQNDLQGGLQLPSLPALAELFIGHNQLKQFDLKPSPLIATIDVSSNNLQKLPESLGRCINLRALDASNNDLAELPCSLGTLPKLQRIALDGNPLRSVRRDVIERGCEAVKAFLRTRAATPAEKTSEDDFDPLALANRVRDPVCTRRLFYVRVASMAYVSHRTRAASSPSPANI